MAGTTKEFFETFLAENLQSMTLSNPTTPGGSVRVRVRPVLMKGSLVFQIEEYTKTQVFHKNLAKDEAVQSLCDLIPARFLQVQAESSTHSGTVLANRKGTVTVKIRPAKPQKTPAKISLEHNRQKRYILPEGEPLPFLVHQGVVTKEGKLIASKTDKFRQINRFLEFIADIVPSLPNDRTIRILDFGCGKSYLTFAVYWYLSEKLGRSVSITGMDLKESVIKDCNELAVKCGYTGLSFLCGDVADYDEHGGIDMMMTLHACDTATDIALACAVRWKARVILSVPCCQHELNAQIHSDLLSPVLSYGILKERMSALLTDGLRAELLSEQGYDVQLLEFIDMEHTPKNILIRAVQTGKTHPRAKQTDDLMNELHASLTLKKLLDAQN